MSMAMGPPVGKRFARVTRCADDGLAGTKRAKVKGEEERRSKKNFLSNPRKNLELCGKVRNRQASVNLNCGKRGRVQEGNALSSRDGTAGA